MEYTTHIKKWAMDESLDVILRMFYFLFFLEFTLD